MSGPKIVRIVTREEKIAICEAQLARLASSRAEWIRVGKRNVVLDAPEITDVERRHSAIQELLKRDRFAEVQSAVASEVAGLQEDMERRLAAVAAATAAAQSADRRRWRVAQSLLTTIERTETSVPPETRDALQQAASGQGDVADAIRRGFALLSESTSPTVSQEQRALADSLKDGDDRQSIDQWIAGLPPSSQHSALNKIDEYVATLRTLTDDATCMPFRERIHGFESSTADASQALKIDSLMVEVAKAVTEARARSAVRARLLSLAAELEQGGGEQATSMAAKVRAGLSGTNNELETLESSARLVLEDARAVLVASARRRAVLTGLAGLGYQVTEQMETAWVSNGRIVLRSAARPGYGVELGGGATADRVQLRTVAIRPSASAPDPVRDRDAETIWCSELSQLQNQFGESGGEIVIEQATEAGAVPLRVISEATALLTEAGIHSEPAAPRKRSLRERP